MAINCEPTRRRGMTISVIALFAILCAVLIAYMAYGDNNDEQGLRTLRMISILFRHGDKAPSSLYPKDPHINYEWPGGLSALSEVALLYSTYFDSLNIAFHPQKGTLEMYNLGKNLRLRYFRLLPQNGLYSQQEMFVLSSYAERCLMSAQSLLAGFVPPLENRNILPIPWQPVPVSFVPRLMDQLIAQKKPCSKYDKILKNMYQNPPPDLRMMNQHNQALFEYLTKNTGKNISTILDVEFLYNTLEIEERSGLVLPKWTADVFPERMLPLAERSYTLFTDTDYMKKIKGGAFITEVLNNMIKKKRKTLKPDRKIFLYSGHDVTLVNVMNSMSILDETSRKPDFASALVFELHHSFVFKNDLEVKLVYYFNSDDKFPKEISIPGCDYPCSLTKFSESVKDLILENYDEACENTSADSVLCPFSKQ